MKKYLSIILAIAIALSMIGGSAPYIYAETPETAADSVPEPSEYVVSAPEPELVTVPAAKSGEDMDADEMFAGYVDKVFMSYSLNQAAAQNTKAATRDSASDLLPAGSLELKVYNALLPYLKQVAAGDRASTDFYMTLEEVGIQKYWTAADLGLTSITDSSGSIPDNTWETFMAVTKTDIRLLMNVLLNTVPYELYWYDKTRGFGGGYSGSYEYTSDYNGQEAFYLDGEFNYYFVVSEDYMDNSLEYPYFTVDTAIGKSIQHSAQKAASIVQANKSKRDVDKLTAYRDAICALTEYNWDAAYGDDVPYGNPWQLIWVFDEDESTNVVCEGYSKAFQYLFDMSTFYGDISCRLVTGDMDGGGHMWNVVTMPDGRNYLMDVTNSDEGDTGSNILFFKGGTGSVSGGYSIPYYSYSINYTYDNEIIDLYGESRLRLSGADYVEIPFITTCRLELQGKIGIRIYFRAPDNAKTAKVYFEDEKTHEYPDKPEITLSLSKTGNSYYSASQDLFVMIFPKITSRQMTMHIKFEVLDQNGNSLPIYYADEQTYYSGGFYYSAADWANRIIRIAPSAEAVTMAKSLLAFGGAAQKYLNNYNPDNPANPNNYMAAEMAALKPDGTLNMIRPTTVDDLGLTDIRLELAADTAIRLYFNKEVSVQVDGTDATVYKDKNSDTWLVIIGNINSRRLDHMHYILITGEGGTAVLRYSALSWANDMIARNIEEAIPTAKALYLYNQAAKAYIK